MQLFNRIYLDFVTFRLKDISCYNTRQKVGCDMPFVDLVLADVEQVVQRFEGFHKRFVSRFATQTRNMATRARQYLQGQFIWYLKNGFQILRGSNKLCKSGESMTVSIDRFSRLRGDVEIIRQGMLHEAG